MILLITSETAFRQKIWELVFGTDMFDLDLWVQVDSVKQQIKRDSLGSEHVSHRRTSAFNNHVDCCFTVFKNVMQGAKVRMFCVCAILQ